MYPALTPVPGYAIGWTLATVLGGGSATLALRREGLSYRQIAVLVFGLTAAVYLTARLPLLLQQPSGTALNESLQAAFAPAHLGMPVWFALAVALGALLARLMRLQVLPLIDSVMPAAGLIIFGTRIGCFLEGCCHGRVSDLLWAIHFPPGSPAYAWHLHHDLIWLGAPSSLPVHPVQLYFALLGLLLWIGLTVYQSRKRFHGELLLWFALVYISGTRMLGTLRT